MQAWDLQACTHGRELIYLENIFSYVTCCINKVLLATYVSNVLQILAANKGGYSFIDECTNT